MLFPTVRRSLAGAARGCALPMLLLTAAPVAALGGDAQPAPDPSRVLARFADLPAPPLAQEIQAVLDSARVAEARVLADQTLTPAQRAEALAELRLEKRLGVLRVQADHAERAGSLDLAASIRQRIDHLREAAAPPRSAQAESAPLSR